MQNFSFLKALFAAQGFNPTDIPAPPQTISDVLTYAYYWGWNKGKLTNIYGGFSMIDVIIKYQSLVSRWWPAIQSLEASFLTGYANCPYLDYHNTADVTLPFLYFGSEFGCPAGSCLTPGPGGPMTKSTDVTKIYLQGYGHVDTIIGSKSITDVKAVELNWMNARL